MATFYKIPAGWTTDPDKAVGGVGVEVNLVGADIQSVSLTYGIPTAEVKRAYKEEMQARLQEQLDAPDVVVAPKNAAEERAEAEAADAGADEAEEAPKAKAKKGKK